MVLKINTSRSYSQSLLRYEPAESQIVFSRDERKWKSVLKQFDVVVRLAFRVQVMRESNPKPLEAFRAGG